MAQLVEQLICNQQVVGSSPIRSSNILWGRAEVAHEAHNLEVGGSNPSPATKLETMKSLQNHITEGFFNTANIGVSEDFERYTKILLDELNKFRWTEKWMLEKYGDFKTERR